MLESNRTWENSSMDLSVGDTCDIVDDAEKKFADESTTTCDRKEFADLIKRSCPKCKALVVDAKIKSKQLCTHCETPLSYQCARCHKQFNSYEGCCSHLSAICNIENLELKCPKCEYQTHSKIFMTKHKYYCSSRTIYSCSHCEFKTRDRSNLDLHMRIKHEVTDESTTTCDRKKPADLIKRSCPKCKRLVVVAKVKSKQLCTQCETPLSYQCARCNKQCNSYDRLFYHLSTRCNAENLDLKCPKCNYQTHSKQFMYKHKTFCSSRTIYSCSHCEFKTRDRSNLDIHMQIKHDVTDKSTATCDRNKFADLIKRSCPKCKRLVVDAKVKSKQLCTQCETPLSYQCARCDKQFNSYVSLVYHLTTKCNAENLELKCPKCDYQTHAKSLLDEHLSYCLGGDNFSCDL